MRFCMKNLLHKYADLLSYLFFGALTTVVSLSVYWACGHLLHLSGAVSNVVSWIGAVAFAFLTNKPFVFKSHDWSWRVTWPELTKFLGCRIGSLVLETAIIFVTVDLLLWNDMIMKTITQVMVVILNYIGSKLLVFRK